MKDLHINCLHHLTNIIIICHIYFLPFDHDLLFVNLIDFNACIGDYIPFPFPPNRKGHLNVAEELTCFQLGNKLLACSWKEW